MRAGKGGSSDLRQGQASVCDMDQPVQLAMQGARLIALLAQLRQRHGCGLRHFAPPDAPPLARALYHSTELEQEIPDGLFTAVAQVLAYVFQLKQYRKRGGQRPNLKTSELPIPPDLRK